MLISPAEKHPPLRGGASYWNQLTNESIAMNTSEFAQRARALKISKEARFEAAFDRAKQELRSLDVVPSLQPVSVPSVAKRPRSDRPILSLPIRGGM